MSFTDSDSLIRYLSGSFIKYSDAVEHQAEMIARGFDDAFIVTYKNGVRIGMNYQPKYKNKQEKLEKTKSQISKNLAKSLHSILIII